MPDGSYIVRTPAGVKCTAIYNVFTGCYFADDVYGVLDDWPTNCSLSIDRISGRRVQDVVYCRRGKAPLRCNGEILFSFCITLK